MKLIADSGSTKTDWCVVGDDGRIAYRASGQGINPFLQSGDEIRLIIKTEVADKLGNTGIVDEIQFYGAGCRDDMIGKLERVLGMLFIKANRIEVCSDMLGAARALFGRKRGVACILGTGSNSCLYDGRDIIENVPPLGYILGDEGSGAVLGRLFVNALFKGDLSCTLKEKFIAQTGLTLSYIINKVYKEPLANRFLASLSPFIHENLGDEALEELVVENFRSFFRRNVDKYNSMDIPLGAVGSIAYYYRKQLEKAAKSEGYRLDVVLRQPMDGLVKT